MHSLGMDLAGWTALTAVGTFTLAGVTAAALIVTVWLAVTDRRRDTQQRKEDRDRDTELRRRDAQEQEIRIAAQRREREDEQARQILVETAPARPPFKTPGHDVNHRISVSWPAPYTVKQVAVQIVTQAGTGLGLTPIGHIGDSPITSDGRILYGFWAGIPAQWERSDPIVRFVDEPGNLYYTYLGLTRRFPQNTDWPAAATEIDQWARTGPAPDSP